MDTLPVTLIVKAPNQQIEDQTVKCELSWTINKLKQHLSEVYPSKPLKHEQKLIYSGQLLGDSVVLKDVLRQFEGQDTHTVHLVCTTHFETKINPKPSNSQTMPNSTGTTTATSSSTTSSQSRTDNSAAGMPENRVPMPNFSVPWVGSQIDPTQYAAHMAIMQQAYLQYMNQYMQLAASSYANPNLAQVNPTLLPQNIQVPQTAPETNPAAGDNGPAAEAPAQPPPPREQENPERDWLDNFYAVSRLLILFSVVYFYSSLLRFTFVLFLGVALYLYQIGFFRNVNNNNNNNTVPHGEPQPHEQPQEPQAPSRLTVVWTFFTTLFASLLPEVPNAV